MRSSLILTLSGADKPGLVDSLAQVVRDEGGNWEESRMSRLAGQFAGVVHVTAPAEKRDALASAVRDVPGLTVALHSAGGEHATGDAYELELVGAAHEGIVSRVSRVLASGDVSLEELWTGREEAPQGRSMGAEWLYWRRFSGGGDGDLFADRHQPPSRD